MCGIAGIVATPAAVAPREEQLRAMCQTIYHRGPDDDGIDVRENVALGMRRLSIIDIAGGKQPLFNEDRSVRVVFNGEIYNFHELRETLLSRGHKFASATDGEVIVHLWEEYGPGFVTHLNGMFAIALHDMRQKRFVLARDRLGIKPLFYWIGSEQMVFGSEIKALLASELVERRLDLEALAEFMSWEYVAAPRTLLQGVRKLEPGFLLELDLQSLDTRVTSYWELPPPGTAVDGRSLPQTPAEWEDAVDTKIKQCVQRQLISDVPLGAFLSGGVDSSLVVSGMGNARTFSIGFDDPSYNELPWSERVARHLGVSHSTEIIQPRIGELFDSLMRFMDDPIGDFSIFPTYLVSRVTRREVTVALSGDGGDECFGGYETYVAQQKARTWARIPEFVRRRAEAVLAHVRPTSKKKGLINKAKRFVEGFEHDAELGHARWRLFVGEALRSSLFTADALRSIDRPVGQHILALQRKAADRDDLDRCLFVDLKSYLSDNCLVKVDRMSMACSLEARVPLLDHELVELAFSMPSELKVRNGETKVLLKKVATRHVPRECVYRPKEGFSIPIKNWLAHELRPIMEELLDHRSISAQGVFDPSTVERLKREHLSGRANHSHILWALIVFQDWRRRWLA